MQKSHSWPTHHADGEIVVHDVVWDLVSILHLLSGDDFQMPAVQHHQGALLDVLQDFCQAAPFITCGAQHCICPRGRKAWLLLMQLSGWGTPWAPPMCPAQSHLGFLGHREGEDNLE